jgi:hypothetical protein
MHQLQVAQVAPLMCQQVQSVAIHLQPPVCLHQILTKVARVAVVQLQMVVHHLLVLTALRIQ